jgi:hypothetical protein
MSPLHRLSLEVRLPDGLSEDDPRSCRERDTASSQSHIDEYGPNRRIRVERLSRQATIGLCLRTGEDGVLDADEVERFRQVREDEVGRGREDDELVKREGMTLEARRRGKSEKRRTFSSG